MFASTTRHRRSPLEVAVPLGKDDARYYAQLFAATQATPEKGKQVYLNTLAVYAVYSYLKWLGIETSLAGSNSWHAVKRALFNAADLVLPGAGTLECRAVFPEQTEVTLPVEVPDDRLGCVLVEFNPSLDEAYLFGFVLGRPEGAIALDRLHPLDTLLDKIMLPTTVNLAQWLDGLVPSEWQPLETLLPALQTRRAPSDLQQLHRGKIVRWRDRVAVLAMGVNSSDRDRVDVFLRVYPLSEDIYLPDNLQVTVVDEKGTPAMEVRSGEHSNRVQLRFHCQRSEKFSVKLSLDEEEFTEHFTA